MSHVERARVVQVAKVAQDGFTRLQRELVALGITSAQAAEILLSYAQLQAVEHGVSGEDVHLEDKRMLFN